MTKERIAEVVALAHKHGKEKAQDLRRILREEGLKETSTAAHVMLANDDDDESKLFWETVATLYLPEI